MRPGEINPQLAQYRAQQAFERNLARLRTELRAGSPRRHLEVLVELLGTLLPECGSSLLTESYRRDLRALERQVAARSNDRIVAANSRGARQPRPHPYLRIIR